MPDVRLSVARGGDSGDFDAFDLLFHLDAVVHASAGLSTTSAEAEKAVWRDARNATSDLRHDVQEVIATGDVEMARVVVTGKLASTFGGVEGTGERFRIDQAVIAHLRDGRIAEAWEIADIAALAAQVARNYRRSRFELFRKWVQPDRLPCRASRCHSESASTAVAGLDR